MTVSTATAAQNSKLYISGTPGSAISITAITKATSAVVTATNTLAVGDVVAFGTVTNMPEINGMLGIVTVASGSSFTVAIDSSGFASAGTTGTATPQTFSKIGNLKDLTSDGGTVSEIDVTQLESVAKEFRAGLQDFGNFTINFDTDDSDAGQIACRAARASQAVKVWKIIYPNGTYRAFSGFVKKLSEPAAKPDGVLSQSVDVRVTGPIFKA